MNIQKLEAVLDQMRAAKFSDTAMAESLVEKWAAQISDTVTEYLVAGIGNTIDNAAATTIPATQPCAHGWAELVRTMDSARCTISSFPLPLEGPGPARVPQAAETDGPRPTTGNANRWVLPVQGRASKVGCGRR